MISVPSRLWEVFRFEVPSTTYAKLLVLLVMLIRHLLPLLVLVRLLRLSTVFFH